MMKIRNTTMASLILISAAIFIGGTDSTVMAQAKYKVGDHVEVDTNTTSWSYSDDKQRWMPATVIEVDQRQGYRPAYMVKVDGTGATLRIPITPNSSEKVWIRGGGAQNGNNNGGNNGGGDQPGNDAAGGAGFKVGDRVEVDVIETSTSSPASMQLWRKGTVTAVDTRPGYRPMYVVQVDPVPGQLPITYRIPITPNSTERIWIRATGGTAPKIETNKLHVDKNDTVLADREPLDCSNFKQPAARNGSALPVDLAKKLVRCALGENPSPQGGEGARTVDISTFQLGAPRRWDLRRDTGAGGTPETIVYPVRVKYSTKTFHREQNIVVTDREQMFACSVQIGEWVCGPDQVTKDGETKRILVTP
jgi:hypothetical protein